MDKYLICGLGNPGDEYAGTRHNTGFMVLDAFAKASNICFEDKRYGFVAETSIKGRKVFLLKPTTFMNLSGNASLLKVVKFAVSGVSITGTEVAVLLVGCVVAFVVSLAAIRFLMDYVKRHDFKFFGIYRIVLGAIVLAVAAITALA